MKRKRLLLVLLTLLCFIGGAKAQNELTVYEGTTTNNKVPAYIFYFDDFTKSQFVIPAGDLTPMNGSTITSIKFYTTSQNVPYTTVSTVDVYLKEVDYTTMTGLEAKSSATTVYQGLLSVVSEGSGGSLTIELSTPYTYGGGNLLIGIENTTDVNYKSISFYGQTVTGAAWYGSNGTSLDNVTGSTENFIPQTTFTYTSGTVISKPTALAASEITNNSATLTWTENGTATAWEICLNNDEINLIAANSNPFTLTGLTPETTYTAKVRAKKGSDVSAWSNVVTFTTDVQFPAPKAVAASNITANSADISWTGTADGYNLRYGADRGFRYDFESAEAFAVDEFSPCTTYDGDELTTYTITGYNMPNANYTGSVIAFSDNSKWAAHSGNTMGVFMDAIPDGGKTANDDYFILPAITIESGTKFSFWARSASNSFGLERMKVGVYGGSGTFSSYLAGDDASYVEVPVGWTEFSYDLSAYVGQTIQLAINCVSSDAFALFIDDINVSLPCEWGTPIAVTTTSYQIEGLTPETSYQVQVQAVYAGGESEWAETSFTTLEDVATPSALAASNITYNTAKLGWTENGDATAWEVCLNDDEANLIAADSNPFTLTGLTAETDYTAKVRAVKGEKRSYWSDAISFTTDIQFHAPSDVTADNITSTSADISWTADAVAATATSFELQYYAGPFIENGNWYQYDNGVNYSAVGLGGNPFSWGIMLPAGSYTGNALNKVSIFDYDDMTGSVTIYNDGDTSPSNAISTMPVTLTGTKDFVEFHFDGLAVDNTKNLWVIFHFESGKTYTAATCQDELNDPNGRWVEIGGNWYDLAEAGVTGQAFMIHAEIGDAKNLTWNTKTNVTSPYTLTELSPLTEYAVKVKAVYADGESDWAKTYFTTDTAFPAPEGLVMTDIGTTTATISWTAPEGATGYFYQYKEASMPEDDYSDNEDEITGNSVELTGLTPGAAYNFRVKAIYADGSSLYSTIDFITDCLPKSLPYVYGFENINELNCWTLINESPKNSLGYSTTSPHDGTNSFEFSSYYSASDYDQYLISPQFDSSSPIGVEFYYKPTSSYAETFKVGYSTTTADLSEFTWGEEISTNTTAWTLFSDVFPAGTKYVAIHYCSEYQYNLLVDDFSFTEPAVITMNSYGIMTYASPYKLDFSNVDGLTAYAVTNISGADLTMTPINVATEGTGLMLKGTANANFSVPVTTAEADAAMEDNRLIGLIVETNVSKVDGDGNVTYILADGSDGINWYKLKEDSYTLKANSAYLKLTPAEVANLGAGARGLGMIFDDGTTAIHALQSSTMETENGAWYTLQGLRLDKQPTTKGIYIHNGRKVVIK